MQLLELMRTQDPGIPRPTSRRGVLIKRMLEVTNQTNGITDEAFADAMEAIESMVPKSETPQPKEHATMKGSGNSCSSMKCPRRPTKMGRPPNTSLRS